MPTGQENAKSRQVAVRLPHELDARIQRYAAKWSLSQSQAMIELMEHGLKAQDTGVDYRDAPQLPQEALDNSEWYVRVGDAWYVSPELKARIEAIEATLGALQGASHSVSRQAVSDHVDGRRARKFNPKTQRFGPLCDKGHDFNGRGQSRWAIKGGHCIECRNETSQRYRDKHAAER